MIEPSSRLPEGWDSELTAIDEQIRHNEALRNRLNKDLERELQTIRESYAARMPYDELARLRQERESAWARVREHYPIEPPRAVPRFSHFREAAEVLAHYWQGEPIDREELLRGVMGRLGSRAFDYAFNLTDPESTARSYVHAAQDFLRKDISK